MLLQILIVTILQNFGTWFNIEIINFSNGLGNNSGNSDDSKVAKQVVMSGPSSLPSTASIIKLIIVAWQAQAGQASTQACLEPGWSHAHFGFLRGQGMLNVR